MDMIPTYDDIVLLLLNVNNTVWHFCLSKRRQKGQKSYHRSRMGQKGGQKGSTSYHRSRMGQKGGQNGSKILPKGGLTKHGSKRARTEVKKGQRSTCTGVVNVEGKYLTLKCRC